KIYSALNSSSCALLIATPESADSGWVQQEYEYMLNLSKNREDFFWVPVTFGEFPDFPFLNTVHAVDFSDSKPATYRRAFQQLLCALKEQPPGANPSFSG